jgi:hypothetical protein
MKPNKKIIIACIISLFLLSFFLVRFPVYIKNTAITKLEETLGRDISSGKFRYNHLTATIYLEDFKIMEADGEKVFLSFDSFNINVDPMKFITKTLYFKEISLINPTLRYEVSETDKNFDDILKKMNSDKKQKTGDSSLFFKKIAVGNILIDRYTFYYKNKTIEGQSLIRFKSPKVQYNDNLLKFSSALEFSKGDSISLSSEVNTESGDLKGILDIGKITLDTNSYIINRIKGWDSISGNIMGNIPFYGNFKDKIYNIEGELRSENFMIKNKNQSISFNYGDINLKAINFPEIYTDINSITLDGLDINYSKSSENKKNNVEKKAFEISNFKITKIDVSDSSIIFPNSNIKNINIKGDNLTNKDEVESRVFLSMNLNEKTSVVSDLKIKFKDILKNSEEFLQKLSAQGNIKIEGENLSSLDSLVKLPYELKSGTFSTMGDYNFEYPKLNANTDIITKSIIVHTDNGSEFSSQDLKMSNKLDYNFKDKKFEISGPGELKKFLFKSAEEKNLFQGDISFLSKELSREGLIFDSISLKEASLDLTKTTNEEITEQERTEETKYDESFKIPNLIVSKFNLENSEVLLDNLTLNKINGSIKNISKEKGEPEVRVSMELNEKIAGTLNGNLLVDEELEFMKDLKKIGYRGKLSLPSMNLEDIKPFLKDSSYTVSGISKLDGEILYKNSSLLSDTNLSINNLKFYNNDSTYEFLTQNINSSFDFSLKEKAFNITNGKFNTDKFQGFFGKSKDFLFSGDKLNLDLDKLNKNEFTANDTVITNPSIIFKKTTTVEKSETIAKSRPKIKIKKLDIQNGKFEYLNKDSTYSLEDILLKINNLSTSKDEKADISLSSVIKTGGNLDGKVVYNLKEDWEFSPKKMDIDGNFKIDNLDLMPYKNILKLYFPNELESGKTDWNGDYKITQGKLKGSNNITFKNISLGKETGENTSIPLKTAVELLSDQSGNFNLKIPVSGDLNNPKFKLRDIFTQSLKSILIKTVTSPIDIITKTFESKEVSKINFIFLSENLALSEIKKLEKISEMLKNDENLKANFTLYTDFFREKELLRLKNLKDIILMSNTNSKTIDLQMDELMNSRKNTIINFFKGKSMDSKISVDISLEKRISPQSDVTFISP